MRRKPGRRIWIGLVATTLVLAAFGLYWFQPWRLFTTTVVHDQLPVLAAEATGPLPTPVPGSPDPTTPGSPVAPTVADVPSSVTAPSRPAVTPTPGSSPTAPAGPTATRGTTSPAPAAVQLAHGELITHEHATSGTVRLVRLPDGRRVLTLEHLRTSDGPALHVWLTDQPVLAGPDGWHRFDDGRVLDLGPLEGNEGDQVYAVPADADLTGLTSATIWCERFSVSFGAAALTAS